MEFKIMHKNGKSRFWHARNRRQKPHTKVWGEPTISIIYITCKNRKEAERICSALLKEKLIACANFFPIHSLFRWKGKIEKAEEYAVIAKTLSANFKRIEKLVKKIHSYDVPCIISFDVKDIEKDFKSWLMSELG